MARTKTNTQKMLDSMIESGHATVSVVTLPADPPAYPRVTPAGPTLPGGTGANGPATDVQLEANGPVFRFYTQHADPIGKLADLELHFGAGPLTGLKLVGFGVWASKRDPETPVITYPARQYSVNGERRSFALLRPVAHTEAQDAFTAQAAAAYRAFAAHTEAVNTGAIAAQILGGGQ